MRDSLGNCDPKAYNAVHWDGTKWELKRIYYKGGFWVIKSIFAFNANDIWFSGYMRYYNGQFIDLEIPEILIGWGINKLWGSSSSDLYAVGNNGNIAHWDGVRWKRIESGTTLDIYDIWGEPLNNGSYEILFVAAEHFIGPERKLFSLKNFSVQELSLQNVSVGSLNGVWFKSGRKYFVVGNGIYSKTNIVNKENWVPLHSGLTQYYTYSIRGTELNNIFICGSFGESLHFNGYSWQTFRNLPGFYNAEFLRADVKQNIIVAVGYRGSKGFIALSKN